MKTTKKTTKKNGNTKRNSERINAWSTAYGRGTYYGYFIAGATATAGINYFITSIFDWMFKSENMNTWIVVIS